MICYFMGADSCKLLGADGLDFPIDKLKTKGLIIMKLSEEKLTKENANEAVTIFEINKNLLEHLYSYFNDVLSPLMQNTEN